jgi:hypothetical protein
VLPAWVYDMERADAESVWLDGTGLDLAWMYDTFDKAGRTRPVVAQDSDSNSKKA